MITAGRVTVWQRMSFIMQIRIIVFGKSSVTTEKGMKASEIPLFKPFPTKKRATEAARKAAPDVTTALPAQWQSIQEPSSFGPHG